jgi:signal transduction histidine kinase
MVVYDTGGNVVFENAVATAPGASQPIAWEGAPLPLPIEVGGEVMGYLQIAEQPAVESVRNSPETRFLNGLDRVIRLSALTAAALALILGVVLAGSIARPLQELTQATKAVAGGEFGHQVPVRTQDEIGELAVSFNKMSADLARSDKARRQMAADIAHDLRTPLSVILGYSEALAEGKLPGTPETYEAMHVQALQLNRLIDDLRTLSLADAGQITLQKRPVDPRTLLEHALIAYLPIAENRGISMKVESSETRPVLIDPDRMLQVLGNLVSNALDHTPDGGSIVLSAAGDAKQAILRVQDSGPGVLAEDLPFIFDRFYRGDKARRTPGASGLGLAIARSLVEAHGGSISAENTVGRGALFIVRLPYPQTDSES